MTYDRERARLTLPHFSHYVIEEKDDGMAYASCAKDNTCPIAKFTVAVPTAWYHDGVHYCMENGLMSGYGNGIFKPDAYTTRAIITVMLWRLNGSPVVNYLLDFKYVEEGRWYTEAVRCAKSERLFWNK